MKNYPFQSLIVYLVYFAPWYVWVALVLVIGLWLSAWLIRPSSSSAGITGAAPPAETRSSYILKWITGNGIASAAVIGIVVPGLRALEINKWNYGSEHLVPNTILFWCLPLAVAAVQGSMLAVGQWIAVARSHPQAWVWAKLTFMGMMAGSTPAVAYGIFIGQWFSDIIEPEIPEIIGLLTCVSTVPLMVILASFWLAEDFTARWQFSRDLPRLICHRDLPRLICHRGLRRGQRLQAGT